MEDERIEEDADKGDKDVEDAEDVETSTHNNHTHKLPRYMEPFRLHPDMRKIKQPNDNKTGHTQTQLSTLTTTTCAATVDMMCPVGTQVPHAQAKRTTLNITMQLIVTMLSSTGPRDGGSAKKQCTKSPYQQIRAPTRHDG